MWTSKSMTWIKLHQNRRPIALAISSIITMESELSLGDENKLRTKIILGNNQVIYADESFDTVWKLLGSVG
jgi:hypothetical protein